MSGESQGASTHGMTDEYENDVDNLSPDLQILQYWQEKRGRGGLKLT